MSALILGLLACGNEKKATTELIKVTTGVEAINDSFTTHSQHWKSYSGHWQFKNKELLQDSIDNSYPVLLRVDKSFSDLDLSIDFKPISGEVDASGGLIFRAEDEDNYYIVRANALEGNFRLYTFTDGLRHQLASASVTPPALSQFHQIRVIAKGNHIQAFLNGKLEIDYHDDQFKKGYSGLWTKADSVTVFDNFKVVELLK